MNPAIEIERLYRWLGLPSETHDHSYPLAETGRQENVERFGVGGVAPEKLRSVFDSRDVTAFTDVAGNLLQELGYPGSRSSIDAVGR